MLKSIYLSWEGLHLVNQRQEVEKSNGESENKNKKKKDLKWHIRRNTKTRWKYTLHKIPERDINKNKKERKSGEGGSGSVYRGHLVESDTAVAVRKSQAGRGRKKRSVHNGVEGLSSLRQQNLVQLIG